MIDLAIARAPHQVLYSIERLRDESGCRKILVLDMFKTQDVGNCITRVLEKTKWDRIIKLNYSVKTPFGIMKYISYLIVIKIMSYLNFKIRTLVVGDGDIVFAKLIVDNIRDIQKLVVIGDGLDFSNYSKKAGRIEYPCNVGNKAKEIISKKFNPDGFNVGVNVNIDAGQTVPHVHIHLIPRFKGDVKEPRGGVREIGRASCRERV